MAILLLPQHKAFAEGGVHIVVMEQKGVSDWDISEFIDNSLIGPVDTGIRDVPSYIFVKDGMEGALSVESVDSRPLVVFASGQLANVEDRINQYYMDQVGWRLQNDSEKEILGGLFQIPMWLFVAASEVSTSQIEAGWHETINDARRYQFPAANYAGTGDFEGWDVLNTAEYGFYLNESGEPGEGNGVAIFYHYRGDLKNLEITVPESAHLSVVYLMGEYELILPEVSSMAVEPWEILGPPDEIPEEGYHVAGLISSIRLSDGTGILERGIFMPVRGGNPGQGSWQFVWQSGISKGTDNRYRPGIFLSIIICWLVFGVSVLIGNWIYSFNDLGSSVLLVRMLAYYPLFLMVSLLASGFWGLGFIPSAVLMARFLAPEGRRLRAASVIMASSFIVMFVSWGLIK
ncbi:MAG: hypothetical protein NTY09_02295 [bacterium]|nr:hypothetical protein [bacterium]